MPSTVTTSLCPQCGERLSGTTASPERGDALAVDRMNCPNCGAHLVRDVDGHADRGWRLTDKPSD